MQGLDSIFNSNQFNLTDIIREISSDTHHKKLSPSIDQHHTLSAPTHLNFKQINNAELGNKELSIGSEWSLRSNMLGKSDPNVVYASAYPNSMQPLNKYTDDFITTNQIDFEKETPYVEDNGNESPDSVLSRSSKKIAKLVKEPSSDSYRSKNEKGKGKKHPWQPSEDAKVLELLGSYGQSWALIAAALGNRTGKQVRDRYLNYLRPDIKDDDFTIQEDRLLLALYYQMGHKWSRIASHIPGRTECQVKNRFYAHIKKRLMFPDFNAKNMAQANNIASALFANEKMAKNGESRDEVPLKQVEKKEEFLAACQMAQSSPDDQTCSAVSSSSEMISIDNQGRNTVFGNQGLQNSGNVYPVPGQSIGQNMQTSQSFMNNMVAVQECQNIFSEAMKPSILSRDVSSANTEQNEGNKMSEHTHTQALLSLENELINRDKMKRYEELVRRKNALEFFYTKTLQEMNNLSMEFGIPNML